MEGANEIDGKLSFVILNLSFEIFKKKSLSNFWMSFVLNFDENYEIQ